MQAKLEKPFKLKLEAFNFPAVFHFVVMYIFKIKISAQSKCQQQIIFDLLKVLQHTGKKINTTERSVLFFSLVAWLQYCLKS